MAREESRIIKACMRCGSTNLEGAPGGVYAGFTNYGIMPLTGRQLCKDCGSTDIPIEFDDEESYKAFLRHLKEMREKKG